MNKLTKEINNGKENLLWCHSLRFKGCICLT